MGMEKYKEGNVPKGVLLYLIKWVDPEKYKFWK
jgi:hypothetical protein